MKESQHQWGRIPADSDEKGNPENANIVQRSKMSDLNLELSFGKSTMSFAFSNRYDLPENS